MKKLIFFFLMVAGTQVFAFQKDTTIVEYNDTTFQKKIRIKTSGDKEFVYPRLLNLNQILKALDVDSTERNRVWVLLEKSGNSRDTLIVVSQTGNRVSITTKSLGVNKTPSANDDEIITYEPNEKDNHVGRNYQNRSKNNKFFSKSDFAIYLGLNAYTHQNDDSPNDLSDLKLWPSRYIALSFRANATLANNSKSHLVLSYGPEIAWHNFMLTNSHVLTYENRQSAFILSPVSTSKSKFVVPHLNFPVMLNMGLKKEKFKLGVGGYLGYRIGGYTKVKYQDRRRSEKDRETLGLNDFKYGLTTEFGRKNGWTLFFRYDLSNLFKDNQVNNRDKQAFAFGVRI